jgi:hypothetical protein
MLHWQLPKFILMGNPGFIYIMSLSENPSILKIGKSKDPQLRAKHLSAQTASLSTFTLEWSKKVTDMDFTERVLLHVFGEYHFRKEFYQVDLILAKDIANLCLGNIWEMELEAEAIALETELLEL